jgi:hypothetical protein
MSPEKNLGANLHAIFPQTLLRSKGNISFKGPGGYEDNFQTPGFQPGKWSNSTMAGGYGKPEKRGEKHPALGQGRFQAVRGLPGGRRLVNEGLVFGKSGKIDSKRRVVLF